MAQRLPTPGSDDNTWGDILNGFLNVAHATDGSIASGAVGTSQIANGAVTTTQIGASAGILKTQLATAVQTSLGKADTALQSVADATSSVKGVVQLTGDLGGTAASPLVAKLNGTTLSATAPVTGQVLQATSATGAAWTSINAGGVTQVASQTANFTAAAGNFYPVDATSGGVTVTLPTSTTGQLLILKKIDSSANLVTLSGTINGASSSTLPLRKQYQSKELIADGSGGWTVALGDLDLTTLNATATTPGLVQLAGDLTGTATSPALATTGVSAGSYGSNTTIPAITVDAKGRITSVSNQAIQGITTYATSNTGNNDGGKWTKLATQTVSVQYQDAQAVLLLQAYADGEVIGSVTEMRIRTKQQSGFGGNPYVEASLITSTGRISSANVIAVITQNSPSSIVDFYVQVNEYNCVYSISVLSVANTGSATTIILNAQGYVATASLPSGQGQVNGKYDQTNPASVTQTGGIRLAGDLGGTATAPTVPTKVSKSGDTMTGGLTMPNYQAVKINTQDIYQWFYADNSVQNQTPFGEAWYDLLAFGKYLTITSETTTNGSSWSTATTDKRIFSHLEGQSVQVVTSGTTQGARWTFSTLGYSAGTWLMIDYKYISSSPNVIIYVQSSPDNSTWTTRHNSTYTAGPKPVWHYVTDYGGHDYIRIQIQTTDTVKISSIRLYTQTTGYSVLGKEVELPYTWNENGYIGIGKGTTAPSYPLDVTGDVNVTGQIHGVTNPTAAQDVSTKSYVDNATVKNLLAHADPVYKMQSLRSVLAVAPTITSSTTSTITGGTSIGRNDARILFNGPTQSSQDGNYTIAQQPRFGDGTLNNSNINDVMLGIEFTTDASSFEAILLDSGGGVYVTVNGSLASTTPYSYNSSAYSNNYYVNVSFGSRARRRIGLWVAKALFAGLKIPAGASVWPVGNGKLPKIAFLGDSYCCYGPQASGVVHNYDTYAQQLGRLLGFQAATNFSASGTGYVKANSSSYCGAYSTRVSDLIAYAPDIVVVQGSLNDYQAASGAFTTAVTNTLTAIKNGLPGAVIIATGILDARNTADQSTNASQNTIIQNAAANLGLQYVDAAGWITGTGMYSSPTGDGNADYYTYSDRLHPLAPEGGAYLASRMIGTSALQQFTVGIEDSVNAALQAVDTTAVHLTGAETISGVKTFSMSPKAPAPTAAQDVSTKSYVDALISNTVSTSQLTSYTVDTTNIGIPFVGTNGITVTETSSAITIGYSGSGSSGGSGGAIGRTISQVSSAMTAAATANTDYVYWWSGATAYTLTMPTAASNTNLYTLKNTGTIGQVVATTSSQTIDGTATITVNPGNAVDLISNGSNWMVV